MNRRTFLQSMIAVPLAAVATPLDVLPDNIWLHGRDGSVLYAQSGFILEGAEWTSIGDLRAEPCGFDLIETQWFNPWLAIERSPEERRASLLACIVR